jgi:oligopeptidase B
MLLFTSFAGLLFLAPALASGLEIAPPVASKIPHVDLLHGDSRTDNYRWMHENTSPNVKAHLEAENAYASALISNYDSGRIRLYEELKALRESSAKQIVLVTKESLYFKSKTDQDSYWDWFRTDKKTGRTVKFFSENEVVQKYGYTYFFTYQMKLSPSEEKAFFVTDVKGRRHVTPFVVDLKTLKAERFDVDFYWYMFGFAWLNETEVLCSATDDEIGVYQLYKYNLESKKRTLLHSFSDLTSERKIKETTDRKFVVVTLETNKTKASFALDRATETLSKLSSAQDETFYETIDHNEKGWFKLSNRLRESFQIFRKKGAKWKVFYSPKTGMIKEFFLTPKTLVVKELDEASERIVLVDLQSRKSRVVPSPTRLVSYPSMIADQDREELYFQPSSYVLPPETFSCSLSNCVPKLSIPTTIRGFNASAYESRLIHVKARDGESIPVSLFYRKDLFTGKNQAVHLNGYGSYGGSFMPNFKKTFIPLMDRGVIGVVAHVRGGREKGERWYDQGRYMNKLNTFYDFIDVADHLVAQGLTSPSKIAIEGQSAGGLLMGAVLNLRPELFRVALMKVPFVDVLNTMTLYNDPLAKYEKKEWGDGLIAKEYFYMKQYDPYTNVSRKPYPSVLLTTGFEDAAVYYFHPMKWVAKMREWNPHLQSNPILFFTSFGGGHWVPGDEANDQAVAKEYSFVLGELGL